MPDEERLADVTVLRRRRTAARFRRFTAFAVVAAGVGLSLVAVALGAFRPGAIGLGLSVVIAAVLRGVLPDANAGWLAVRSRTVDVVILGVLGGALLVFAVIVPAPA